MNGYLAASFYRFHVLEKQKLIKTDRRSHVGWPAPREGKVLWKTTTKIKDHLLRRKYYILKKVLHFRVSAVC